MSAHHRHQHHDSSYTESTLAYTTDFDRITQTAMKIILAVNAGSSSVKISVFAVDGRGATPRALAEAQVSGLTAPPPRVDYRRGGTAVYEGASIAAVEGKAGKAGGPEQPKQAEQAEQPEHPEGPAGLSQEDAFGLLLRVLVGDAGLGELASPADVAVVAHRIVHGGDYTAPQVVSAVAGDATYAHLERLSDLAPLHNGPALAIVRACGRRLLPGAASVACFDSAFHATLPPHVRTYPIDPRVAAANMLRKYGFHGLSYAFVTRAAAAFLGKPAAQLNLVALHLGSGASACAVRGGASWDTSMGLTPLAGLPGATRSGSVDPSLVFHYASDVGRLAPASTHALHISRAEQILNKEAGWKALTGTTDFAAIAAPDAPASHRLAFDLFVDRVCAFVGSYYVSLRGDVDALVFAGGIGEHSPRLRAAVADQCRCLGFALDAAKNEQPLARDGPVTDLSDLSAPGARHRVLVCRTDEQLEMARECAESDALWA